MISGGDVVGFLLISVVISFVAVAISWAVEESDGD
tara:strand:+ start:564 stop:668 length:105 start_codon:yes stop_codon:yes gene_type:complete